MPFKNQRKIIMDNINQFFRNIAEILNCSEEAVKNQISEIIETALEENDPILTERQTKIISEGKEQIGRAHV